MSKSISGLELVAIIQSKAFAAGSQKALALSMRISPGYLSDVLCQRREISSQLAQKFGYEKVVSFRRLP